MVLHVMNLDFDHIRYQILTCQEIPIPAMESLTIRLLRVTTLKR